MELCYCCLPTFHTESQFFEQTGCTTIFVPIFEQTVRLAFLASPKKNCLFNMFVSVHVSSTKHKGSTFSTNGTLRLPEPEQSFDSGKTKALQYLRLDYFILECFHPKLHITLSTSLPVRSNSMSLSGCEPSNGRPKTGTPLPGHKDSASFLEMEPLVDMIYPAV